MDMFLIASWIWCFFALLEINSSLESPFLIHSPIKQKQPRTLTFFQSADDANIEINFRK